MSIEELAKLIVHYVAQHTSTTPAYLTPKPEHYMSDPQGLLVVIAEHAGVTPEQIDAWIEAAR